STRETMDVARAPGATVVGAASIIDRGAEPTRLDVPFEPLVRHALPTWDAEACPLCQRGVPIMKPGSRG
ncbi:MAG: orotate phosphoribosyltransferase, partial [Vicinamibacterales bacterium]